LTGAESQPVVHIPLPGWVWNLERRKQWRDALNHWRRIDNLVILVELPPAKVAEAVLLGSNLPNLLWLSESGAADAAETRAQLETLRHARCNLVGAVLNRESETSMKRRFPRWLGCMLALVSFCANTMHAQEVSPAAVPLETRSFSIVNPAHRAAWQQHLTLGPGDVVTLSIYGQPDLTRQEVSIAPDGMVNYLEATNVLATGLTVDELRTKLDDAIGQYRRAPRTIITPIAFKSKKYYMLGKVMAKGVYTLDRPLTVLEAIARARGFENGLVDRNIIDLADFQRSFIMRDGKRIPLNFEKLFQEGDLTQNVAIEPGDYVYFPSTNMKEVYVVGEVRLPGPVTHTPTLTIIGAIAARAGYSERAYKSRVVVVRGSLNNPQLYAVDTKSILEGRGVDFKLQPKDIIYVNSRPFIRVEEIAELATTAFIQSLITTFVGVHVVKPIQ
jgi:protein involved in polysaccharide export with SLBB domain